MNQSGLDAIFDRRSIRKFQLNRPLEPQTVHQLLEAGFAAPSSRARFPQHFILVDDRKILNEMKENHPFMKFLDTVPLVIVVCGDEALSPSWMNDCAASTENILLAAQSMGLGACWCGGFPTADRMELFARLLSLPEHIKAYAAIAVGYPDEVKGRVNRYQQERVHQNHF